MATRLLSARLNLLSARHVLNAGDVELSDGGGLSLRCAGDRAAWVFRYTSITGKRREMGLGACGITRRLPARVFEVRDLGTAERSGYCGYSEMRAATRSPSPRRIKCR